MAKFVKEVAAITLGTLIAGAVKLTVATVAGKIATLKIKRAMKKDEE